MAAAGVALAAVMAAAWPDGARAQPASIGRIADEMNGADMLEPVNRWAFAFNRGVMEHVLEPFAAYYLANVPPPVQDRVRSFFGNLREPATAVNAALLGRFEDAAVSGARFAVNTTWGLLGLYDEAAGLGLAVEPISLEQVLCEYRIPEGPFLVLPILGPATLRDAVGRIGTLTAYYYAMGPVYLPYRGSDIAVQYVDLRGEIRRVEDGALDPYAVHRASYLMRRRHACPGTGDTGPVGP